MKQMKFLKNFLIQLKTYHNSLQSMRESEFIFDYFQLVYYKCHKINLNRGGSYIDSPEWIKNKKATINPINKKDTKCFQYAVTVAWNYEEINKDPPQRITKIKHFINKHKWGIHPAYVSKHNSNRGKQVIPLMISNGEGRWHYLEVKNLSALLRRITFKHQGGFYCLNCFHSFVLKNKLQSHKKVCEKKIT